MKTETNILAQGVAARELANIQRLLETSPDLADETAMENLVKSLILLYESDDLRPIHLAVAKALLTDLEKRATPDQIVYLHGIKNALEFLGL